MIINYILENDKCFIGVIISALMIMLFSIFSFKIISKIKTGTEKKVFLVYSYYLITKPGFMVFITAIFSIFIYKLCR